MSSICLNEFLMTDTQRLDKRREAGERTRRRLLDATRELLAEHGGDAFSLRDITEAAQANVAAVSYHFGSKEALCREAVEEALRAVISAQAEGYRRLADDAPLEEIAAAFARPVVGAAGAGSAETFALLRIVDRAMTSHSPGERDQYDAIINVSSEPLLARLRQALPNVPEDELRFRIEAAAGILHFLASDGMRIDLTTKTADDLERLLVPVIAGALAGGSVPTARGSHS
jgi:AcrR family transcriptional regulator